MVCVCVQKREMRQQMQECGLVLPTRTFFENEERRYTNIFTYRTQYSCQLASPRELLQNSADAGTQRFDVDTISLTADEQHCAELECRFHFVRTADTGRWCHSLAEEARGTYAKCLEYFLSINGSSKHSGRPGEPSASDGGFGVGRLVILFCAPLWLFTARHLLVVGHFNQFRILCRSCLTRIAGPQCAQCGLREHATPLGTVFMVHYKMFHTAADLTAYARLLRYGYYSFSGVSFPIRLNQTLVASFSSAGVIHRGRLFQVCKIEFGDALRDVTEFYGSVCDPLRFTYGMYMVRTAQGVPMFTKIIYSDQTEVGMFYVDLDASVSFRDFDQSRQSLQNDVGHEFDMFIAMRSHSCTSRNLDQDVDQYVSGLEPWLECVKPATSARCRRPRRGSRKSPDDNAPVPRVRPPPPPPVWEGFVRHTLKFTCGRAVHNVPLVWLPGHSWQQIYLLMLWAEVLNRVVPPRLVHQFRIGLMFSERTEAMLETVPGDTCVFYLDPEQLQSSILRCAKVQAMHTEEKLSFVFDEKHRQLLVAAVISDAVHEVTHLEHAEHNEQFASAMNVHFTKVLAQRLMEQMLRLDPELRTVSKHLFVARAPVLAAAAATRKRKSDWCVEDPFGEVVMTSL